MPLPDSMQIETSFLSRMRWVQLVRIESAILCPIGESMISTEKPSSRNFRLATAAFGCMPRTISSS